MDAPFAFDPQLVKQEESFFDDDVTFSPIDLDTEFQGAFKYGPHHTTVVPWNLEKHPDDGIAAAALSPYHTSDSTAITSVPDIPAARSTRRRKRSSRALSSDESAVVTDEAATRQSSSEPRRRRPSTNEALRRNALAARRCREKRRDQVDVLKSKAADAEQVNQVLIQQCSVLREDLYLLKNLALTHVGGHCDKSGMLEASIIAQNPSQATGAAKESSEELTPETTDELMDFK